MRHVLRARKRSSDRMARAFVRRTNTGNELVVSGLRLSRAGLPDLKIELTVNEVSEKHHVAGV
jgi:hypothetical protein